MSLWLIEGLPGSGKSTMAERLCSIAMESGYDAVWFLEESDDHPVHPKSLKVKRRNANTFIDACLEAWSQFTEKCRKGSAVYILEGSAFQSTVRFMMEERLPAIDTYYRRYEEVVAPLNPQMIYLRPREPITHSRRICDLRGKTWTEKVAGYLEMTSYSRHAGLTRLDGMHRFWTNYATLCDKLVSSSTMPVKTIDVIPGEWERHKGEAMNFLRLPNHDGVETALRFNTAFDTGTLRCGSI
jgi:hypothetical protein